MFIFLHTTLPYLLRGAGVTLLLSLACIIGAAPLGLILGLMRMFGRLPTRILANTYLYLMRGVPLVVLLFCAYYMLPYAGLNLSAATGGVIVLSLYYGAFMSEVFRAALLAVPRGQWDAGRALGMHGFRLMAVVVLPQAVRLVGPPFISTCITLVKETSLVSTIGLWELTEAGREVLNRTFAAFQVFGCVAAIYFIICYGLSLFGRAMERRVPNAN